MFCLYFSIFFHAEFYQKPKKLLENIFLLIVQRTKNLTHVTKKAMKFRHARTHAKFPSSKVRREKLCIDESLSNL
jgi:hypothetical protein